MPVRVCGVFGHIARADVLRSEVNLYESVPFYNVSLGVIAGVLILGSKRLCLRRHLAGPKQSVLLHSVSTRLTLTKENLQLIQVFPFEVTRIMKLSCKLLWSCEASQLPRGDVG